MKIHEFTFGLDSRFDLFFLKNVSSEKKIQAVSPFGYFGTMRLFLGKKFSLWLFDVFGDKTGHNTFVFVFPVGKKLF